MNQEYWVSIWAKRRQDEVIHTPYNYIIHEDFLKHMDKDEIKTSFLELNSLFRYIYSDIAKYPKEFGMPLYSKDEYRLFSKEWRDSGQAPYRPFILLYNLLICGEIIYGTGVAVSIQKYKALKPPPKHLSGIDQKIRQSQVLFKKLTDYGFVFDGLKNNKPATGDIIITYPDNPAILYLLKHLVDKAYCANCLEDFLCCHFRLLQNDIKTVDYGTDVDIISDRVTDEERKIVCAIDSHLKDRGFFAKPYGGIECHGVAYYHNEKDANSKKPYSFRITTRGMDFDVPDDSLKKMRLQLRIRNVSKCVEYVESCPDSIKQIFTEYSDDGCGNRERSSCKHGIEYEIDNKNYWRCACCHAAFNIKPELANIPHYIKLVELGEKK